MKAFAAALVLMLPSAALADVRLPHIIGDHMALQAGQPLPIWGWADAGEQVTVRFAGQSKSARADATGHWQITLSPVARGHAPEAMTITGHNSLTVSDIVIGEVWLASGQSNMEKPLGDQRGQKPTLDAEAEIAAAAYPDIRLFKVTRKKAATPADDVEGQWVRCDPTTIDAVKFSAAAYFFGRKLHSELHTPVGLIEADWGGTRIEPWTPHEAFATLPSLTAFAAAAPGEKVEGIEVSTLYNAMVAPLVPYAVKGLIWYQGESNIIDTDDGAAYADKMTALVTGWRTAWHATFPVYYVQVAPHLYHVARPTQVVSPEAEPRLWEAQTASLRLPKTGMVVTTDLVDDLFDIHPRDKKTVGERLANLALANDYGRAGIVTSGPMFKAMTVAADRVVIDFDAAEGLKARDGKPLTWFTLAGADGRFWPGIATIDGARVVVSSPHVPQPVTVHFAWDEGAQPNLVNGAGLPATPFRSDNPFLSKSSP